MAVSRSKELVVNDRPDWIGRSSREGPAEPSRPTWLPETPHSRQEYIDPETEAPAEPSPGAILSAYAWHPGTCVRCHDRDRYVTSIATLTSRDGTSVELLMCGSCVLREEERRMHRAAEAGVPYTPGRIGRAAQ